MKVITKSNTYQGLIDLIRSYGGTEMIRVIELSQTEFDDLFSEGELEEDTGSNLLTEHFTSEMIPYTFMGIPVRIREEK